MHIVETKNINNNNISIVEVNDPIAIKHCSNRFEVILIKNNQKIFQKNKQKFLKFEDNDYIYQLKSNSTNEIINISPVLFHELLICDKSYEECTKLINDIQKNKIKITTVFKY